MIPEKQHYAIIRKCLCYWTRKRKKTKKISSPSQSSRSRTGNLHKREEHRLWLPPRVCPQTHWWARVVRVDQNAVSQLVFSALRPGVLSWLGELLLSAPTSAADFSAIYFALKRCCRYIFWNELCMINSPTNPRSLLLLKDPWRFAYFQ